MAEPILRVEGLIKRFGGIAAADNLSLDVRPGEIHAVIGPNGAGKTTLIGQLAGEITPDAGRIIFAGRDITRLPSDARSRLGLARSFQITSVFLNFSVLTNVALAVQAHAGHSFGFWRDAGTDERLTGPAGAALAQAGLAARADLPAASLSHGEQRQLEIAMALATSPSVLLLDEPMAGMGAEETAAMVDKLRAMRGKISMLLVEHDMDVVFALADRITVLVYGRAIATGAPDQIREDPAVRAAYLGDDGDAAA